jgi:hypothetical protein
MDRSLQVLFESPWQLFNSCKRTLRPSLEEPEAKGELKPELVRA